MLFAVLKIVVYSPALEEFRPYLIEYARNDERRLTPRNESLIRILYRRSVYASTDPFKK